MPHTINIEAAVRKTYTKETVAQGFIDSKPRAEKGEVKARVLWIGCSDSLVSETECLAVERGEILVHRNLGNIISNGDLSSGSAVEWGVDVLKVEHVIVCGHYECSLLRERDEDALHGWHKHVTKLHAHNERHLSTTSEMDTAHREEKLEEVHVLTQTEWLRRQPVVSKAIKERGLQVHAFVFDKEIGECVRLVEGDAHEEGNKCSE